jgi:hypothetical protein
LVAWSVRVRDVLANLVFPSATHIGKRSVLGEAIRLAAAALSACGHGGFDPISSETCAGCAQSARGDGNGSPSTCDHHQAIAH